MNNRFGAFWNGLGRGGQLALLGGSVLIVGLMLWLIVGLLRDDYGVLFAELAEPDAATIVKQLKKEKVPYRLADGGTTILVPAPQVHDVRLLLMSGDVPLRGGVGFEIFDKQGLGATEHAQKVSYQRALQGELARTIETLDHVKQVRVHLVMPESTLFTRDRQQASAAVAVTLEPGTALERQQISGVQRLVAAAVPGLDPARVVITDQRGVSLSLGDSGGAAGSADARLQVKRDIEDYMTHKIVRLLDSAFGPGQAIVSVDANLNFDATKTTIQDLLPAAGDADGQGRVVRRRQVTGSASARPMWTNAVEEAATPRTPSSSSEVEYEYGRRIDEVIAAPGALSRLSVGVIVPGELTEEKRTRIAELVRVAAGIDATRGDAVSVQPLSQLSVAAANIDDPSEDAAVESEARILPDASRTRQQPSSLAGITMPQVVFAAVVAMLIALLIVMARRNASMSVADRRQLLAEIQQALRNSDANRRAET